MMSESTTDSIFEIGAEGIDASAIVAEIRKRVAEKRERGDYLDARVARAERTNLSNLKDQEDFLSFYLDCLSDAIFVDINDFEIYERRAVFSKLLILLKRTIWKLLKFYTYRLWSQQNQINGLLLSAVANTEIRYKERIRKLEERVAKLEQTADSRPETVDRR
jgi:hypothetical protein